MILVARLSQPSPHLLHVYFVLLAAERVVVCIHTLCTVYTMHTYPRVHTCTSIRGLRVLVGLYSYVYTYTVCVITTCSMPLRLYSTWLCTMHTYMYTFHAPCPWGSAFAHARTLSHARTLDGSQACGEAGRQAGHSQTRWKSTMSDEGSDRGARKGVQEGHGHSKDAHARAHIYTHVLAHTSTRMSCSKRISDLLLRTNTYAHTTAGE